MNINVYHHFPPNHEQSQILKQINIKLDLIMSKVDDLSTQVDALQASVDVLQAKVQAFEDAQAATIAGLNKVIADLQAQIAASGTPEALQAVLDKVTAIKADVESTVVPDPPPTASKA